MSESQREHVLADRSLPEALRRALESGLPLEEIRLDSHGYWWHDGARIDHARIQDLFDGSVTRTPGGTFLLAIGPYTYPIIVEDTPLFVRAADVDPGSSTVWLTLSDGRRERLDPSTLVHTGDGRLIATVRSGECPARFLRHAYHSLLDHLDETDSGYVLRLATKSYPLAR